jgi:eukaryotic-like serine/threonine-protein kinase
MKWEQPILAPMDPDAAPSPAAPTRARLEDWSDSRFEPIALVGRGGMADVYLALSNGPVGFNKLVALKLLRQGVCDEPEIVGMFWDEARLAARLDHENLIDTYETGEIGGRPFIAMEYLRGQPLSRVRQCVPNLPLELKLWVIARALVGLHYAHELRGQDGKSLEIVHRDVSPSNLMLTYDGRVKLLDFGVAKAASAENLTRLGVVKGKMGYCPPEQLLGARVDRRADVFSMGVTLWELLVGRRLSPANDSAALGRRVEGREDLRSGAAHVPEALLTLCERAMAYAPENRFATAGEMATAIEAHIPLSGFRDAPRSLGSLLTTEFRNERARLQATIERRLGAAESARKVALTRDAGPRAAMPSTASATVPQADAALPATGAPRSAARALWSSRYRAAVGVAWPGTRWLRRWRLVSVLGVLVIVALVGARRGATEWTARGRPARLDEAKRAPMRTQVLASLPAQSPEPASSIAPSPAATPAVSLAIPARPSSARLQETREPELGRRRLQPQAANRNSNSASRGRAPARPATETTSRELDTRDPWK